MLAADRLTLALDIHAQSYALLRWVGEAVGSPIKNFQLLYPDFVDAEESLTAALRSI